MSFFLENKIYQKEIKLIKKLIPKTIGSSNFPKGVQNWKNEMKEGLEKQLYVCIRL